MRIRALLILAMTLLGVMALSGAAIAATKTCSANPCVGTNGADKLKGNATKNEIFGLRGADYIAGKPRADELYGNRGQDEVRAGNGRDRVFGGRGEDQLYGGSGNDTMNAQDGYKDNVNCGLGTDTAYVDKRDLVNEGLRERLRRRRPRARPGHGQGLRQGGAGERLRLSALAGKRRVGRD